MCTLSILAPSPGTFVLAFNRDEHPSRPEIPPSIQTCTARPGSARPSAGRFIAPGDGLALGTWVGVNDAGLAFALLNRNEPGLPERLSDGTSRGSIVPSIADAVSLDDVAERLERIASGVTRGFRLIVSDGTSVLEATGPVGVAIAPLDAPFIRTSSGLGDHLVRGPRTELFSRMVIDIDPADRTLAQRDFHLHRWPDRTWASVLMDRDLARTVSQTRIEVDAHRVRLAHSPRLDEGFGVEHVLEIDRR
jgi:hypothetical protein